MVSNDATFYDGGIKVKMSLYVSEVTSKINLPRPYLATRLANLDSPLAVFMRGILEVSFEYCRRLRGSNSIQMHDPVDMRLGRRTWATEYCDLKIETSGE